MLGKAFWNALDNTVPHAKTMGAVGILALIANVSVAVMLYRFRAGDANKESVWLCSRNDAIGNLAVIGAAIFVYFYQSQWPDLMVAVLMSLLGISAAVRVIGTAREEISG